MKVLLIIAVQLGFVAMGIVQWVATYSFFRHHWDWHWLLAFPAALFAAYTPLLGSICGVVAAMKVWHWDVLPAMLLFFWWPALTLGLGLAGVGLGFVSDIFNKRRI